jgi:hypothetical protein
MTQALYAHMNNKKINKKKLSRGQAGKQTVQVQEKTVL